MAESSPRAISPFSTVFFFSETFVLQTCKNWSLFRNGLTLPSDKILDWSNLKAFADDIIKILEMMIFVFDRVENIVGRGEKAGYQHFLLFPQCFQKFFPRVVKSQDCVLKS